MIASSHEKLVRTGGCVFFHHVQGTYPVMYMSMSSSHRSSSQGLPIQITQRKKMSDTMPKRTHRVGRTFLSLSRRSEINEFIIVYNVETLTLIAFTLCVFTF